MNVLVRLTPHAIFFMGFAFAKAAHFAFGTAPAGQALIFAFTILSSYFATLLAVMLVEYRRARRGWSSFVSALLVRWDTGP